MDELQTLPLNTIITRYHECENTKKDEEAEEEKKRDKRREQ
jgi:hypothetical protein